MLEQISNEEKERKMNNKYIKPAKPLFVQLGIIILSALVFLGSDNGSNLIVSNTCINLDSNASVCITRNDDGTPSTVDWFPRTGCPRSLACPSLDSSTEKSNLALGDSSDIFTSKEEGEICTDGHSNECLDKEIFNPTWYQYTAGGNAYCKCYDFTAAPPYTCTPEQLANPPSWCS